MAGLLFLILALASSPGHSKAPRVIVLEVYMSEDREEAWAEITYSQVLYRDECEAMGAAMLYALDWCTIEQMQSDINWHWKLQRDSIPVKRKF